MAEDCRVSLKITTDTSDLAEIPQKADAARKDLEKPVKVPVKQPEPVKVPVKQPEPVKVPVKQPEPVKITADISSAEKSAASFFSSVRQGVSSIRTAISSVFAAFGMVTFVVTSVQSLIAGFQKLYDIVTSISRSVAQIRFDGWVGAFNDAADALIGKHQRIVALLKEEQDVAGKAASLQSMARSQDRAQEDQARSQVRQQLLASEIDPRKRQQLEDRFAAEDDEIARQRFSQDRAARMRQLDDEENMYRAKERGARGKLPEIDREISNQEEIVRKSRMTIENGGDKEKYDTYIEAAHKRIASLKDERRAVEELIVTMAREADYRAAQARIIEQSKAPVGGAAARAARHSSQDARDRQEQEDFDRRRGREAAESDFEERLSRAQRQATSPGATEDQRNAAEHTQIEMLRDRERQAAEDLATAEAVLAEELRKDVQNRDERKIGQAREDITAAEGTAYSARSRREALEGEIASRREKSEKDYFGNLAREIESSRPQNRLTAMGLGSGSSSSGAIASDVKRLVRLMEDQVRATKDNKPMPIMQRATWGE